MRATALVTARLKSERLAGKALRKIGSQSLLAHLFARLRATRSVEQILLCTSRLDSDDALVAAATQQGIDVYRGDPDDVLLRLANASAKARHSTLACVTADNPFVDPEALDQLIGFHQRGSYDYSRLIGLPIGSYGYALAKTALRHVVDSKSTRETEIWGPLFERDRSLKKGVLDLRSYIGDGRGENLRLTVDTPEDYELACRIADALQAENKTFTLANILLVLEKYPAWQSLNSHVIQRQAPVTHTPQI